MIRNAGQIPHIIDDVQDLDIWSRYGRRRTADLNRRFSEINGLAYRLEHPSVTGPALCRYINALRGISGEYLRDYFAKEEKEE